MSQAVSRDLALSTVPLVRLFDAPQLRICVLPRVIHPHARAERHLVRSFRVSVGTNIYQRRGRGDSLGQSSQGGHTRPQYSVGTLDRHEPEQTLSLGLYARALPAPRAIAKGIFRDLKQPGHRRSARTHPRHWLDLYFIRSISFHEVLAETYRCAAWRQCRWL